MTEILFWTAAALVVYTYLGFPILIMVRALLFPQSYKKADIMPDASVVIAAYNEAKDIGAKLSSVLASDYPADKLHITVASDGSTDETNTIVEEYAAQHPNIQLLPLPRQGKAKTLNTALQSAVGEIVIFTDANSLFAEDAIRHLLRPFADPSVGGVAGNQVYKSSTSTTISSGEKSYWSFDRLLKIAESRGGNVISATGALYAIRRHLYQPLPDGVTDDFVTSTRVIAQGHRLVFEPDAIAYEAPAATSTDEFARKVRVMTRGLTAVLLMRELLNPFKHRFYALQLFTHKFLRRILFIPLLIMLITTPFLINDGWFYLLVVLGELVFLGTALFGYLMEKQGKSIPKPLALPFYVVMVYLAAMLASWNVIRGQTIGRWDTQRE